MESRGRSVSPRPVDPPPNDPLSYEDDSIINTRQIEAFGRTVHATASQLIASNFSGDAHGLSPGHLGSEPYRSAMSSVHRQLRRPAIQRSVFSFAKANPRELIRSNFNTNEIEHRAVSYLPDDLLRNVPQSTAPFSLLDGFRASLPDETTLAEKLSRRKRGSRGQRLLEDEGAGPSKLARLKRDKDRADHRLEMMGIRKTMCASEIKEIDDKIANLNTMRKVTLNRLAELEQDEHDLEAEVSGLAEHIDVVEEELADEEALKSTVSPAGTRTPPMQENAPNDPAADSPGFMSESIYEKLPQVAKDQPSPRGKRKRISRRTTMPILHEHMEPGTLIRDLHAHNDVITALDFDSPFGTMVTASLDDTVRVWDLNAGRCMGLLEGHLSSVRCLQVEENLVATGSIDASIRLWDLSQADYVAPPSDHSHHPPSRRAAEDGSEGDAPGDSFEHVEDPVEAPATNAMVDCPLFTLQAHVDEVTALHFRGNTLVSGSADKTLRQWDLEKGRCVQTLDVLWAAAQAASINSANATGPDHSRGNSSGASWWRPTSNRVPSAQADFIGALQVFDAALACGTADGMVRLWDLRSGAVHRSLVGHTGPVTALQFDDTFLVTASQDRSIRIWDLRTGTIYDAFAHDNPVTSMNFDARRIVAAAGEEVVKVYDKTDGRQWECGAPRDSDESTGSRRNANLVERVRIKDGYLVGGRRGGVVGVWSC